MQKFGRSIIVVAMLALTGTMAGCAIRYPRLTLDDGDKPTEAARPSQPEMSTGTSLPYRTATGSLPSYTGGAFPTGTAAAPPPGNSVSSTFKRATRSVVDALTIKPKVIRAQDPTSLASRPGPIGPDLYVSAARLAESRGDFGDAQTQYDQALAVQADCLPALIGLSRLHHRRGDIETAIRYGRQAAESHPQNAVAHNDLGLCYARQRQFDVAIQSLSQAVQLEPQSKLYRNNLAASLVFAGRINEAQMHLSQAHGDAAGQYNLGYLLYQQGRQAESLAYFQRALQLDPQLRPAAQMVMRLRTPPPTVERPDASRRFHQVGIEPEPQNVRRPDPPAPPPPALGEAYVPSRRLPPVTDTLPRTQTLLWPRENEPRVDTLPPSRDTPRPSRDTARPDPAPAQTQPPTATGDPSRESEFRLPPIVSPEKYSGPESAPSFRPGFDATMDRSSGFPSGDSIPGFDSFAVPSSPSHSSEPQISNTPDFSQSVPPNPGTGESLPLPSADGAPRLDPSPEGSNRDDAFDDISTRPPPMMKSSNPLQLGAPSVDPVGNGTRRLAPPPMPERAPAPKVSPPGRDQAYELWPADSR